MALQSFSKLNIDKALKFALVCIVILSLMMSWIYIPQAEAVVVPALVIGAGVGSEVIGSVIATLVMAVTGVCFDNGFFGDTDNLSTVAYEQGYQLVCEMLLTGGTPATWLETTIDALALAGGLKAGDKIEVPAEVLEYTRNWVNENYDFSSGEINITSNGIVDDNGNLFTFSPFYGYGVSTEIPISQLGSIVPYYGDTDYTLSDLNDSASSFATFVIGNKYISWVGFSTGSSTKVAIYTNFGGSRTQLSAGQKYGVYLPCVAYYDGNLIACTYNTETQSYYNSKHYFDVSSYSSQTSHSTINGTSALDTPQTENQTITIPNVPMSVVGGYSVPAVEQLTGDMVIDKSASDNDEEVVPDVGGIDTEPSFTVPDTWSGIDSWFKAQGLKLTGIFTNVKDFVSDFPVLLTESLVAVVDDALELINEPLLQVENRFNEVKNKFLPFIHDLQGGNGFHSIWHYVVAWVGSLGAWLSTMFTIWSGLPASMVVPVYATAVIVIVLGMLKRFLS